MTNKKKTMAKNHTLQGPGTVEKLADWALGIRAEDIPEATLQQAKLLLLDTIGCGYAALDEEASRAVIATMAEAGGAPQCTVIGSTTKTSAPGAVLLNGALFRILDLNDYVNTKSGQIGGHPSDNIPVALAAAELAGASGRDVLAAIVVGYEIYGRLQGSDGRRQRLGRHHGLRLRGARDGARLMGLDRVTARECAGAQRRARADTAGRAPWRDLGGEVGRQCAGRAERHAGDDARQARHDRPARPVREPAWAGIAVPSPRRIADGAARAPTAILMGCHVKAYPCLATGQSIVHAGLDIHRQVGGDAGRLRHITVAIADTPSLRRQKDDPGRIDPTSREAADHSFNFLAAVAMVDGAFGLAQFDNERWNDADGARRHGPAGDRLRPFAERRARPAASPAPSAPRARTERTTWRRCSIRPASRATGSMPTR